MSKRKSNTRFPVLGYVLLNGLLALLLSLGYFIALVAADKGSYHVTGLFPILLFIWICFTVICIFDALFDRFSSSTQEPNTPAIQSAEGDSDTSGGGMR
jgi:hypothetical protein